MRIPVLTFLLGLLASMLGAAPAFATTLITTAEAALPPPAAAPLSMRGITLGPSVMLISPAADAGAKSPLEFKVKFVPHNQAMVDPSSVKVTYVKSTPVDLTARLKPFTSADGIDMTNAEVPPGVHVLRIDLKDSNGKTATSFLKLTVTGGK